MPRFFKILPLQSSSFYIGYLIFLHIFAYICAVTVAPNTLHVIILFCLMISFLFYLEQDQKIISLEYMRKTDWILHYSDKRVLRMQLLSHSVMMRYFLVLHFQSELTNQKQSVVLFSDMFSDAEYRQVRGCVSMGFL